MTLRVSNARGMDSNIYVQNVLTAATPISGLTDRALRRLFDRLVGLGGIRELSGRATFRLYGL